MTVDRKKLVNSARELETMELKLTQNKPSNQSWFKLRNNYAGETDIYIYEDIGMWGVTANNFIYALQDVNTTKVNLHLSTLGGDIKDGIAIYNALLDHNSDLTVYIDSIVASAGSFIAMAGDTIKMRKASRMMVHEANGGLSGAGTAKMYRDAADLLDDMSKMIAGVYSDRAGGTVDEWLARMEAETWFDPQAALEAGLVDEIIGGEDDGATSNSAGETITPTNKSEIGFALDPMELFNSIKEGFK